MNILVTGGAGYIGSHVVKELVASGHQVVILDNLSKGHRAAVAGQKLVEGDVADADLVAELLSRYEIEGVIHLAADSQVGESVQHPAQYFGNNLGGGIRLLEAMARTGCRYLVFSSTAAVYGEPEEVPITEDHPLRPTNPYGESKLAFERLLPWYEQAYGLRWISLRYFNAAGADEAGEIGEDHNPETHLIPIVLQVALGQREAVVINGTDYPTPDGTCIRDYIHVTDLAAAHTLALDALKKGAPSAVFNLGNGRGFSVRQVIEAAARVVGRSIPVKEGPRRQGDPAVLVASARKIQQELGWRPQYPELETIIATAWRWHSRHPHGYGD